MQQKDYDYIITGAGCAGLSLAMHIVQEQALAEKKILIIEEAEKIHNDRTWCFWEDKTGFFESIVFKQWETIWFYSKEFSEPLPIAPYRYKMIRGIDFYRHCFNELKKHDNVSFLQGKVEAVFSEATTGVVVEGKTITARYVFNSIQFQKPVLDKKHVWLLQHFKGWLIKTREENFRPGEATLMDFRISQEKGTAFCYVLPFSATEALVEYTLFTPTLLHPEEYDTGLKSYLQQFLKIEDYTITETEFGVIPMTNYRFPQGEKGIVSIGTAGGQTKGSSGYTFYFIQQHCKKIVESLLKEKDPAVTVSPQRFHFYDSVLLEVLRQARLPGDVIFSMMFQKNKPQDVLAFLNNSSSLATEVRIISTLPTLPFLQAAIKQIL